MKIQRPQGEEGRMRPAIKEVGTNADPTSVDVSEVPVSVLRDFVALQLNMPPVPNGNAAKGTGLAAMAVVAIAWALTTWRNRNSEGEAEQVAPLVATPSETPSDASGPAHGSPEVNRRTWLWISGVGVAGAVGHVGYERIESSRLALRRLAQSESPLKLDDNYGTGAGKLLGMLIDQNKRAFACWAELRGAVHSYHAPRGARDDLSQSLHTYLTAPSEVNKMSVLSSISRIGAEGYARKR